MTKARGGLTPFLPNLGRRRASQHFLSLPVPCPWCSACTWSHAVCELLREVTSLPSVGSKAVFTIFLLPLFVSLGVCFLKPPSPIRVRLSLPVPDETSLMGSLLPPPSANCSSALCDALLSPALQGQAAQRLTQHVQGRCSQGGWPMQPSFGLSEPAVVRNTHHGQSGVLMNRPSM